MTALKEEALKVSELKIKICGMHDLQNIIQVNELKPDYMGFIFYPKSLRYISDMDERLFNLQPHIKKTAVFVNSTLEEVQSLIKRYQFDAVQLHGSESADYCQALQEARVEVIKAFGIGETFNWIMLKPYLYCVDYFLFDTYTIEHGGSGKTFDWSVLRDYPYEKPYFLSGGLGPENIENALAIQDERLYGLDLNSKFEDSPGLKNIELLKTVLKKKI